MENLLLVDYTGGTRAKMLVCGTSAQRRRPMSDATAQEQTVELEALREAIRVEYSAVAIDPAAGYHFHAGRGLTTTLGISFHARKPVNEEEWTAALQSLSCDAPAAWAKVR